MPDRAGVVQSSRSSCIPMESYIHWYDTGVTPFEAIHKRVPSIINVGVFGCDAFVHQDRTQRDTTCSPKAKPGIYLGHDSDSELSDCLHAWLL